MLDREYWQVLYDERAAIIEYDGGMHRPAAEIGAWRQTVQQYIWQTGRTPGQAIEDLAWLRPIDAHRRFGIAQQSQKIDRRGTGAAQSGVACLRKIT